MQNFLSDLSPAAIVFIIYAIGVVVNTAFVLYVGYKAGDLRRRYWKMIVLYCFLSWFGVARLLFTAWQWIEDRKARAKRFPR